MHNTVPKRRAAPLCCSFRRGVFIQIVLCAICQTRLCACRELMVFAILYLACRATAQLMFCAIVSLFSNAQSGDARKGTPLPRKKLKLGHVQKQYVGTMTIMFLGLPVRFFWRWLEAFCILAKLSIYASSEKQH